MAMAIFEWVEIDYGLLMRKLIFLLLFFHLICSAKIIRGDARIQSSDFSQKNGTGVFHEDLKSRVKDPVQLDPETERDIRTYGGAGVGGLLVMAVGSFFGCGMGNPFRERDVCLYWSKVMVSTVIAGSAGAFLAGEAFENWCVGAHCQDLGNDIGLGLIGGVIGAAIPALGWLLHYQIRQQFPCPRTQS